MKTIFEMQTFSTINQLNHHLGNVRAMVSDLRTGGNGLLPASAGSAHRIRYANAGQKFCNFQKQIAIFVKTKPIPQSFVFLNKS